MTYKISYPDDWSGDGTHYDQRITVKGDKDFEPHTKFYADLSNRNHLAIAYGIILPNPDVSKDKKFIANFNDYGKVHPVRCELRDKRFKDRNTVFVFE